MRQGLYLLRLYVLYFGFLCVLCIHTACNNPDSTVRTDNTPTQTSNSPSGTPPHSSFRSSRTPIQIGCTLQSRQLPRCTPRLALISPESTALPTQNNTLYTTINAEGEEIELTHTTHVPLTSHQPELTGYTASVFRFETFGVEWIGAVKRNDVPQLFYGDESIRFCSTNRAHLPSHNDIIQLLAAFGVNYPSESESCGEHGEICGTYRLMDIFRNEWPSGRSFWALVDPLSVNPTFHDLEWNIASMSTIYFDRCFSTTDFHRLDGEYSNFVRAPHLNRGQHAISGHDYLQTEPSMLDTELSVESPPSMNRAHHLMCVRSI